MNFPRYADYKDSGIDWLSEVPSHWTISRLGFEAWVRARLGWKGLKAEEYVNDGYVFLATPNIKERTIDFENVNYIDETRYYESPEIALRIGDVLLAKDGSTLGTVNVVRSLPRPATVNSSIAVISPNERIDGLFLYYLFQSGYMEATIQRIKGGMGVPHLFQGDLNKFYVPLPHRSEQTAIAAFLDRETARIDTLVTEQEKLIALLAEKRQAVVSHAVTKGLAPSVPLKDSGVEWLGEVPEHWELRKIKTMFKLVKRQDNADAPILSVYRDYGVIEKASRDDNFNKTPDDLSLYQSVNIGDLVVNKMKAWQGSLGISPHFGITSPDYVVFEPTHSESEKFLHHSLRSARMPAVYQMISNGIRPHQWRLEPDKFEQLPLPMPPSAEQDAIVAFLEDELRGYDVLADEARCAIDLLKEHRSALISAAVTGKIDVRQFSVSNIIPFTPRQRRNLLAAEVIRRCHNDNTFGRTKAHKIFYLLNTHLRIDEFDGRYERWIAGPYDAGMMASVISDLENARWYREVKEGDRYIYRSLPKAAEVRTAFADAWGERNDEIERLIDLFRPLDTKASEVIATLYAAWNDFLLRGEAVDDAKLLTEVTTNWHESKKAISERAWKDGLRWMRQYGVVPKGTGSQTIQQMSFGL